MQSSNISTKPMMELLFHLQNNQEGAVRKDSPFLGAAFFLSEVINKSYFLGSGHCGVRAQNTESLMLLLLKFVISVVF